MDKLAKKIEMKSTTGRKKQKAILHPRFLSELDKT